MLIMGQGKDYYILAMFRRDFNLLNIESKKKLPTT